MRTDLLLEMAANTSPDRAAVGRLGEAWSVGDVFEAAKILATWIGQEKVDAIAYVGHNDELFPSVVFAASLAGKAAIPLNFRLEDEALRKLLSRTAPSVAIVDDAFADRVGEVPGVKIVRLSWANSICTEGSVAQEPGIAHGDEEDVALTLFTSGTTGEPKAALLRHRHLTSYVISTIEFQSSDPIEAALVSVPNYHIAGITAVLTNIYAGRRIVYLPVFSPEEWVEMALAENITHAMVVPTMLTRILDVLDKRDLGLPSLKALSYGAGRMPMPVIERAMERLPHVDFVNAYGLTETSATICMLTPDDHRLAAATDQPSVRRRLGSVGRPLDAIELQVRDSQGEVVSSGEEGEIFVRGPQVAGEYRHKNKIQTDGWFATNDSGWLDEDGFLFITGRLDDVIVRGGENISPGEIEDVIREHPAVRDVAVFGVPDVEWGEKVAASVVVADDDVTEQALVQWVRARLKSTKTPGFWDFRAALPYNETGKLLRRTLKAELS